MSSQSHTSQIAFGGVSKTAKTISLKINIEFNYNKTNKTFYSRAQTRTGWCHPIPLSISWFNLIRFAVPDIRSSGCFLDYYYWENNMLCVFSKDTGAKACIARVNIGEIPINIILQRFRILLTGLCSDAPNNLLVCSTQRKKKREKKWKSTDAAL